GAVAVLFLFVVMMLDIDFAELRAGFIRNFPLGLALAVVLFVELFVGLVVHGKGGVALGKADGSAPQAAGMSNIEAIGALLYSRYLFLFEAAGIVLLVAMIGAIVLTHRQRSDTRGQNVAKQNARRPEEATINLQPEIGKGVQI
ncbi:MAG: NADH-quinone oxidoreductase subunit J, partial [Allorhizobium sp.]